VGICADEAIERIDFALREPGGYAIEQGVELRRFDWLIRVTPIDVRLAAGLAYEKFVFGRATGVFARLGDELAVSAEFAFTLAQRMLVERADRKIAVDGRRPGEAETFELRFKVAVELGQSENGGRASERRL
jgi:hypothetical protein